MLKRNAHLYYSRLSSYYHGRVWLLVRDITKDLQNTWSGVCMLNCQLLLSQQKGSALADIVHHHRDLRDSKQVLIRLMISAEGLSEKQSWLRALRKNTGRLQLEKKKKNLTCLHSVQFHIHRTRSGPVVKPKLIHREITHPLHVRMFTISRLLPSRSSYV